MQLARASSPSSSDAQAHNPLAAEPYAADASSSSSTNTTSHSHHTSAASSALDILSAATWPNVDEDAVLLQPHDVRTTWREFLSYSNVLVQQALSAQQANRLANNRMPPLWALLAMLVLGWNEAMALIFNPLYLILGAIAFLFLRRWGLWGLVRGPLWRAPPSVCITEQALDCCGWEAPLPMPEHLHGDVG